MEFTPLQKKLLNDYQTNLPVCDRPFAVIAKQLNASENEVIKNYQILLEKRYISRIGAVVNHKVIGASTLSAMSVPSEQLESTAEYISALPEVNHNYEREDKFNLWFVLAAESQDIIDSRLNQITNDWPDYPLLNLPMVKSYHIDLGFPLWS